MNISISLAIEANGLCVENIHHKMTIQGVTLLQLNLLLYRQYHPIHIVSTECFTFTINFHYNDLQKFIPCGRSYMYIIHYEAQQK